MTYNEYQEPWLHIMETTELPQCKGKLFDGTGYCCLGLDMRFVEGVEPELTDDEYKFHGEIYLLDITAQDRLCLAGTDGTLLDSSDFYDAISAAGYEGEQQAALTEYNDHGATFKQIAAAIRAVPHAVFTNFKEKQDK